MFSLKCSAVPVVITEGHLLSMEECPFSMNASGSGTP